jgi:hypothetical protein
MAGFISQQMQDELTRKGRAMGNPSPQMPQQPQYGDGMAAGPAMGGGIQQQPNIMQGLAGQMSGQPQPQYGPSWGMGSTIPQLSQQAVFGETRGINLQKPANYVPQIPDATAYGGPGAGAQPGPYASPPIMQQGGPAGETPAQRKKRLASQGGRGDPQIPGRGDPQVPGRGGTQLPGTGTTDAQAYGATEMQGLASQMGGNPGGHGPRDWSNFQAGVNAYQPGETPGQTADMARANASISQMYAGNANAPQAGLGLGPAQAAFRQQFTSQHGTDPFRGQNQIAQQQQRVTSRNAADPSGMGGGTPFMPPTSTAMGQQLANMPGYANGSIRQDPGYRPQMSPQYSQQMAQQYQIPGNMEAMQRAMAFRQQR